MVPPISGHPHIRPEVSQRIADVKRTWIQLRAYWTGLGFRDTTANKKWPLLVSAMVIRSRLLYGLEAIHLTKSLCCKVNAFHHHGLRKILRLTTTFVDRRNTSQKLFDTASRVAGRPIIPFENSWKRSALSWRDISLRPITPTH